MSLFEKESGKQSIDSELKQVLVRHWRGQILGFFAGALFLCLLAAIQKFFNNVPLLRLEGYVVPVLAGGMFGFILHLWYSRLSDIAEQLRQSEVRHRRLAETYPDGIILCRGGSPVWINNKAAKMLQIESVAELGGKALREFISKQGREILDKFKTGENIEAEHNETETAAWHKIRFTLNNGSSFVFDTHLSIPFGRESGEFQVILRDTSVLEKLQRSRAQLSNLAYYDRITGLPNRVLLNMRLERMLHKSDENREGVALLWLDIDRFKQINNSFGYKQADSILRIIGERLSKAFNENEGDKYFVARPGGDEFVILIRPGNSRYAVVAAQKVLAELGLPIHVGEHELMIKVSMGISLHPADGRDAETLMRKADSALNRAKQQGGNTYQLYTLDINAAAIDAMMLGNDLWQALERKEFVLYYQPQVDIINRGLVGAEAVIRWLHPQRGLVPPDKFIDFAEETGLIMEIGEWVLLAACLQNKQWQAAGYPPMRIGVNLSGRQIADEYTIETVTAILHKTRLDPQWLKLEVTESLIIENPEQAIINMQALKKLGVTLSIDDFGTGYSSFSYLKRLPVDELKIDREFVRDIPGSEHDRKITPTMIAIGHSLQLNVVAEGVETEEQLDFLQEHDCDVIQGFLVSKPVPAEEFEDFFKRSFQQLT